MFQLYKCFVMNNCLLSLHQRSLPMAAREGYGQLVAFLVEKGADININDESGVSILLRICLISSMLSIQDRVVCENLLFVHIN